MENFKKCNECQESKPLSDFYKQSKAPDGYQYRCKKCANKARQVWVEARSEEVVQRAALVDPNTMKTCSRCKESKKLIEFYRSSNTTDGRGTFCIPCSKASSKENRALNIEERKEYGRRYRASRPNLDRDYYHANKISRRAANEAWKIKNPGYSTEWARNNSDKTRAYKHKRRANLESSIENFTPQEWLDLCDLYSHTCLACKLRVGELDHKNRPIKLTADHVVPVSAGGSNAIDNIQPLCGPCNSSKGTKTIDYRQS